ncbi:MAG: DNA-binding NarL/FixJ family response regulator [Myxococcota bacterium]
MVTVRILLVDDEPKFRNALAALIAVDEHYQVCGSVDSAADAILCLDTARPDIVLTDLNMPGGPDGIQLTKAIRTLYNQAAVMILSSHHESVFAERALLAGASGYLMKVDAPLELFDALGCVKEGGMYLSETMSTKLYYRAISEDLIEDDRDILALLASQNPTLTNFLEASGMSEGQQVRHINELAMGLGYVGQMQLRLYAARWMARGRSGLTVSNSR